MARFSVGVEADEGPSLPKRQRIVGFSQQTSRHQHQEEEEVDVSTDQSIDDEADGEEVEDGEESINESEEESEEDETIQIANNQIATSNSPAPVPIGLARTGGVCVTLTDPEVLDCPVCYEALTIPVFQCENGHTACSSCCKKLLQKCPTCSLPIGYNRCRAIEKVLESVRLSCPNLKYGCKEIVTYSKKVDHEKTCSHAPCVCPLPGCSFDGSSRQIYQHFSNKHKTSAFRFRYGNIFPVFFTVSDNSRILQEEKEGVLFLLNNTAGAIGNIITVSCVGPSSSKGGYYYQLSAKKEGSNLNFQSFMKNIQKVNNDNCSPHSSEYLVVPPSFFGSYEQISLDVCICKNTIATAKTSTPSIRGCTGAAQRIASN